MPGALLKLLVKDKLPHSKEVPVNEKEWQVKPPMCHNTFRIVICVDYYYYYSFMWYSTARSGSPQDALHLH